MSDQHIDKKHKHKPLGVVRPQTPRSPVKPNNRPQAQRTLATQREQASSLTAVYSGPDPTARKDRPRMKSSESHLKRAPAQNLEAASPLRAASQTAADSVMSDLDDVVIVNQERSKPNIKRQVLSNNLDDLEGAELSSEVKELKRKRKAVVDSSSDVDSLEGENIEKADSDEEASDKDLKKDAVPSPDSKNALRMKNKVLNDHNKHIISNHVLKRTLEATGLTKAQDARNLKPHFNEDGSPMHFVDNILVPHLDRDFNLEWDDYGSQLLRIFKAPDHMDSNDQDLLLSVSDAQYRAAFKDGVFATMKRTWKKCQEGNGDDWLMNRRKSSKGLSRRKLKAGRRKKVLDQSGLDGEALGCVGDPNFQSEEEDDPDLPNHRIVWVPEYRNKDCNDFLACLDNAFNGSKRGSGNQQCEGYTYKKANIPVPKLKSGKVPQCFVLQSWKDSNPDLERKSRQYIDLKKTTIPNIDKFREYLHQYEPPEESKRVFAPTSGAILLDKTVSVQPEPHVTGSGEEIEPSVKPVPACVLSSPTLISRNPTPLPVPDRMSGSPLIEYQDPINPQPLNPSNLLVKHPLPSSAPNPNMSPLVPLHTPLHPPIHELAAPPQLGSDFNLGAAHPYVPFAHNQVVPGPQPNHPQLYPPNILGQHVPVQLPDGQVVYVWQPMNSQLGRIGMQGSQQVVGQQNTQKDIPIDPDIIEESLQPRRLLNDMPPPPEINHPVPEDLDKAFPSAKSKNTRQKGKGGSKESTGRKGTKGGVKGKEPKSKAVIEDEDEGEETENTLAIAGPSRLPPNAGKPSSIHLIVRGA